MEGQEETSWEWSRKPDGLWRSLDFILAAKWNHGQVLNGETTWWDLPVQSIWEAHKVTANSTYPVTTPSWKGQPKLSPRNSSAYAYWDRRDSFIFSWHLWTRRFCLQAFIFQSILVFIPRHVSILAMCPYVLATCQPPSREAAVLELPC